MPLDSDIADADSHLFVEFFEFDREPYKGQAFVRIMNPGDKTSVLEQPAREYYTRRFPRQWLAYQMKGQADFAPIGTPLETWNAEEPESFVSDQMRELLALGFRTVEQVATATDHQMQRVGMGGPAAREKAKAYLARKNRSDTDRELADTKAQLAEMRDMLAQLVANGSIQADQPRRGRPPKTRDLSDVHDEDASIGAAGDERVGGSNP